NVIGRCAWAATASVDVRNSEVAIARTIRSRVVCIGSPRRMDVGWIPGSRPGAGRKVYNIAPSAANPRPRGAAGQRAARTCCMLERGFREGGRTRRVAGGRLCISRPRSRLGQRRVQRDGGVQDLRDGAAFLCRVRKLLELRLIDAGDARTQREVHGLDGPAAAVLLQVDFRRSVELLRRDPCAGEL